MDGMVEEAVKALKKLVFFKMSQSIEYWDWIEFLSNIQETIVFTWDPFVTRAEMCSSERVGGAASAMEPQELDVLHHALKTAL
ncbi:hypothetical protein Tco_0272460 [Tanacetum coccineum]